MNRSIDIHGRAVRIELSRAAAAALRLRTTPLVAEMRILFSCLARKEVRFLETESSAPHLPVTEGLTVRFSPVVTRVCTADGRDAPLQLQETPVVNPAAFVPHWLRIDYRAGEWSGEFGYV